MSEEDKSLFLEAMQDVLPLNQQKTTAHYDAREVSNAQKALIRDVKRKLGKESHATNSNSHNEFDRSITVNKVTAFESLLFHQKGIRLQELTKLKKGEFNVQAVLDLHGLTIDKAEIEVLAFINEAYQAHYRYIRIIHGKGYNSESEFPILKNLTNQMLRQHKSVLAFSSTPEKDGGSGAVNIFLKSH